MAEITIPVSTARIQYTATAGQTIFPYNFPIFAEGDLTVIATTPAGVSTTLVLTTDYTVSGVGSQTGGNVTLVSGATLNDVYTVFRSMDIARLTDFNVTGDYRAVTINKELDSIIMMLQQTNRDHTRAMMLRDDDTKDTVELPLIRASKILGFDSNNDPIMFDPVSGVTIAGNVLYTPSGGLVSTDLQAATDELEDGKANLDSNDEVIELYAGAAAANADDVLFQNGTWGAIVDTVSNAISTAYKFADGTMICVGSVPAPTVAWNQQIVTLAAAFVGGTKTVMSFNAATGSAAIAVAMSTCGGSVATDQLSYRINYNVITYYCDFITVGRWKA